jgi:hypothetical protein
MDLIISAAPTVAAFALAALVWFTDPAVRAARKD